MSNNRFGGRLRAPTCPECGDQVPLRFNFCPRCMTCLRSDPNYSEAVYEIDEPPSVECYVIKSESPLVYVLAEPNVESRRLFVMSQKDVLLIREEQDDFYQVATPAHRDGFVSKDYGLKVKISTRELEQGEALGFFRVNEHLIKWKAPYTAFNITYAPITVEPLFESTKIAKIKSDIVLPIVGETYGWLMLQLPSGIRGWVPEAYGYRMLQPDSLPGASEPASAGEVIAGIAGLVGAVTLAGIGVGIQAMLED